MRLTPSLRLASVLLGEDIEKWVRARRGKYRRSWRSIAEELSDETGRQVSLTGETLRRRFTDLPRPRTNAGRAPQKTRRGAA